MDRRSAEYFTRTRRRGEADARHTSRTRKPWLSLAWPMDRTRDACQASFLPAGKFVNGPWGAAEEKPPSLRRFFPRPVSSAARRSSFAPRHASPLRNANASATHVKKSPRRHVDFVQEDLNIRYRIER